MDDLHQFDVMMSGGIMICQSKDSVVRHAEHCAEWRRELLLLATVEGVPRLILDLSNVTFLASNCINALILLRQNIKARKGVLCLCCVTGDIREVFAVSKLEPLFQFFETLEEAEEFVRSSGIV